MKLRFHDNSIRLRLDRAEVSRLASAGFVEETVDFGSSVLGYRIETSSALAIGASYREGKITISVPARTASDWIASDQPGIEDGRILIEKDFQCLHGADKSDPEAYPNPLSP